MDWFLYDYGFRHEKVKRSNFREFCKFWAVSRKLIPAKFLAKTNSRKLILSKYASQISKLLN